MGEGGVNVSNWAVILRRPPSREEVDLANVERVARSRDKERSGVNTVVIISF